MLNKVQSSQIQNYVVINVNPGLIKPRPTRQYHVILWAPHQKTYFLRVIPTKWLSTLYSDIYVGILSDILSDILSGIYSDILSGILSGIHSGMLSGILTFSLTWALPDLNRERQISLVAHWALALMVEVRQCPLRRRRRACTSDKI